MGKRPAFQFYPNDWMHDVELQSCSSSTRGIWINALCLMWWSRVRGEITAPKEKLIEMLNCKPEEFELFLAEQKRYIFCKIMLHNDLVTLRNRRMYLEQKDRENTRLRVQKHRMKRNGNADVTAPSPIPSPIPSTKVLIKENSKKIFEGMETLASQIERIYKNFNPWQAIQKAINDGYLIEDIQPALKYMVENQANKPWGCFENIIKAERHNRETKEREQAWTDKKIEETRDVARLIKGIGKPIEYGKEE